MSMIPIKCFTCGEVLANKYRAYVNLVTQRKVAEKKDLDAVEFFSKSTRGKKSIEGKVLDELRLENVCCRRQMLCHVDIL